jgi:hypothetical protein
MADTDNDFAKLVSTLVKYFSNNKQWPYYIRLYKNVPISHIRINNPNRNYTKSPDDFMLSFKSVPPKRILELIDNIVNSINKHNINMFRNEPEFFNSVDTTTLNEDEIIITDDLINLARISVFSEDMDEHERFRDPITVSLLDDKKLSVHPGKKRVSVLEYLFLKNKKEYYIDVIFYKSKDAEVSNNHDGFLIDKEYTHIKTLDDFAKAYGYKTPIELIMDAKNMNVAVCVDSSNQYYLNKYISFTKEDFLKGLERIKKMVESF